MSEFDKKLAELEAAFNSRGPELEITVRDPELGVEGYCVCWNTGISVNGPLERCAKGGTRVTPNLSLDEVKMLSSRMALKNAAASLPLGGAKSGLKADSQDPEIETKYRRFVELLSPILRENGGVFGGFGWDIGARPEYVNWACDTLHSTKSFTGKPVEMGGSDYDNEGIAGLGVAVAAKTLIDIEGEDLSSLNCIVQGLGAMGAAVIRYGSEYGATITAVSDPRIGGTFVSSDGFSPELIKCFSTQDYEGANELIAREGLTPIALDEILFQEADVLFPCAVQDVITAENQSRIKARYLVEGANNPTSFPAYDALHRRGVKIAPDIIANPGGIIAAFVELTTDVTPEENAKNRKIVEDAKDYTRTKIAENVATLIELVKAEDVAAHRVGRYLALKNILS